MGAQLSAPTRELTGVLVSVLDGCPAYRASLVHTLRRYQDDAEISATQALQWTGEKLVKDVLDPEHSARLSAPFTAAVSASPVLASLDAAVLSACLGRAAMLVLEELKLDLAVHGRLLHCAALGRVEAVEALAPFVDFDYADASGATALMIAAHYGHAELVERLLALQPPPALGRAGQLRVDGADARSAQRPSAHRAPADRAPRLRAPPQRLALLRADVQRGQRPLLRRRAPAGA